MNKSVLLRLSYITTQDFLSFCLVHLFHFQILTVGIQNLKDKKVCASCLISATNYNTNLCPYSNFFLEDSKQANKFKQFLQRKKRRYSYTPRLGQVPCSTSVVLATLHEDHVGSGLNSTRRIVLLFICGKASKLLHIFINIHD